VTACERERRRQPHLDFLLQLNGFFIVPAERSEAPPERTEVATERTEVAPEHTEEPRRRAVEVDEEDRRRLESILDFESQREESRRPKWILVGLVGLGALLVAALAFWPTATAFLSRSRPAPPIVGQVQTPPAVDTPAPAAQVTPPASRAVASAPRPEASPSASVSPPTPPPLDTPARAETSQVDAPARPETPARAEAPSSPVRSELPSSLPADGSAATSPPSRTTSPQSREISAPPRPAPTPIPSVPPTASRRRESPMSSLAGFAGLPRVELVRRPAAGPGRGGEVYAVRVVDPSGRPVSGAEVSLLLMTAGGDELDVPLDSGSEPGVYQGTAPPGRAAPTNLRVRVVTSDRRVEVPLTR
jgi:hypothetical protein